VLDITAALVQLRDERLGEVPELLGCGAIEPPVQCDGVRIGDQQDTVWRNRICLERNPALEIGRAFNHHRLVHGSDDLDGERQLHGPIGKDIERLLRSHFDHPPRRVPVAAGQKSSGPNATAYRSGNPRELPTSGDRRSVSQRGPARAVGGEFESGRPQIRSCGIVWPTVA